MKVYVLSPRAAVLDVGRQAGTIIIPVGTTDHLEGLSAACQGLAVSNPLDAVEICRALIARGVNQGDIKSVCVGLGDDSSQTAALVNAALGLAGGQYASIISLERMRDKLRLRECLGVTSPNNGRFWRIEDPASIPEILEVCPNGVVLKPITGSGSRGVVRIDNTSNLELVPFATPMLLEECFSGPEYSVESISWNNRHYPLIVTEKSIGGASGLVETGQLQPARLSDLAREALFSAASDILSTVEYQCGFSHLEFILQDGVPKIVEAHGRVGGDRIADLMKWSLGQNGFELLFSAYKNSHVDPVVQTGASAKVIFPDLTNWTQTDEHWLQSVREIEGVMEAEILRAKGERGCVLASSDRHAQVIITGRSIENIIYKIETLGA